MRFKGCFGLAVLSAQIMSGCGGLSAATTLRYPIGAHRVKKNSNNRECNIDDARLATSNAATNTSPV